MDSAGPESDAGQRVKKGLEDGGRQCDAETITHEYSTGAAEGDLCSVKFARASVGQGAGWPVTVAFTASAMWPIVVLGWLDQPPTRHGFDTDLWTLAWVAVVITQLTGVRGCQQVMAPAALA